MFLFVLICNRLEHFYCLIMNNYGLFEDSVSAVKSQYHQFKNVIHLSKH